MPKKSISGCEKYPKWDIRAIPKRLTGLAVRVAESYYLFSVILRKYLYAMNLFDTLKTSAPG